jgi:hypothetical protein
MVQSLTFYLNAFEINPKNISNYLEVFRIPLNFNVKTNKDLSHILKENNIVFHYQPSDYFEYKAGYYIYDTERLERLKKTNDILLKLEYYKECVEPISYVVRGALLKLIENKLRVIEGLRRARSDIDEKKFYFSQDLLNNSSILFRYHRCFTYRVEYIHEPTKKLMLLILPSILIIGKASLEVLIKERKVPNELLFGLPFKIRYEDDQNTINTFVGFLENITNDTAIIRPADLTIMDSIKVPLKNLYAIGRLDLYKKVVEYLGEDYNLLYDSKGQFTFAWEKGKKIKDAPLRMKDEVKKIYNEVFIRNVFPLELQNIIYTLSDDLISLRIGEE